MSDQLKCPQCEGKGVVYDCGTPYDSGWIPCEACRPAIVHAVGPDGTPRVTRPADIRDRSDSEQVVAWRHTIVNDLPSPYDGSGRDGMLAMLREIDRLSADLDAVEQLLIDAGISGPPGVTIQERLLQWRAAATRRLTVEEARERNCCRICLEPISDPFVVNFGKEYAHQKCLNAALDKGGEDQTGVDDDIRRRHDRISTQLRSALAALQAVSDACPKDFVTEIVDPLFVPVLEQVRSVLKGQTPE